MNRASDHRPTAGSRPYFSVIALVTGESPANAKRALESVIAQGWQNWELVVVVQGPGSRALDGALARVTRDPRTRFVRQHTRSAQALALNDAVDASSGFWLALLNEYDYLLPSALSTIARALQAEPAAVLAYSDCSWLNPAGGTLNEFRKPDWSPERLRGHEYVSDLTVLSAAAVRRVGGFRAEFGGACQHDLLLRATENGGAVVHVPQSLYVRGPHRGEAVNPATWDNSVRAVQQHCDRLGLKALVARGPTPGTLRLTRTPLSEHKVSVIIPTRGSGAHVFGEHRVLIVEAVRSMIASSPDIDFEVVVVADEPLSEAYTKPLREMLGHRLVIVKYDKAFNFSEKSNLGALHASGDMLVFANDDLQIITPQWLEGMVALAEQPDVGLVGAFLRFEDGSVQHAGHIYFDGLAGHAHFKSDPSSGYFGDLVVDHEASGATAALVACRRSVWREVGGFCLGLPDSFNDVDFCLKIRARGYRIVIAMGVEAWHFESKTRDPSVQEWEVSFLQDRWLAATKVERYMRAMG